ncbi:uncharacterized protein [Miscanthus floridulus]|uniref:uncharacterized protein n=1 Tax=Miscanthus floridulus TaxID=154761 RepID=UPI00345AAAF6
MDRQLNIAQCNDREKVLYASGQLQGSALNWWESFHAAHAHPNLITWQEFSTAFRNYHVPAGLIDLKLKEFLDLKQGPMSVTEYRDQFTQLSRYAPEEVANPARKQRLFMGGLRNNIQIQLLSNVYPDFQTLVDRALVIENKLDEMGDLKRKKKERNFDRNTRSLGDKNPLEVL